MEYRHKVMRGTVSIIINKAMRDIRSDPRRSIRNLVDLGENFSSSAVQKHFFSLARQVLKNPDNPYNDLVVDLVENVRPEVLRTMSLNFGYTALNYGAETIRRHQRELGFIIPWILVFRLGGETEQRLSAERISELAAEAVSLGIYTFAFEICDRRDLETVNSLCSRFGEAAFFVAAPAETLSGVRASASAVPNLVLLGDMTREEPKAQEVFRYLKEKGCFYGFYARYNEENAQRLMSETFLQNMCEYGCRIGAYVGGAGGTSSLEAQMYRFVCEKRGKKGEPIFSLDFYRDTGYIGNEMACGGALVAEADGTVPGFGKSLAENSLAAFLSGAVSRD